MLTPRYKSSRAISRIAVVVVVIVILVVAAGASYFLTTQKPGQSTTQSTTQSISSTSSSSVDSVASTSSSSSTLTTSSSSASSSSSSSKPSSSSTLVIDDNNYPFHESGVNQLNAVNLEFPDWFESAVYQPLIDVNVSAEQNSGYSPTIFLPGLASSWTASASGEVYNFSVRQGVKFSNGDPFNAYAVWADFYIQYYLSGNSSTFWNGLSIFNMSGVNFGPATLSLFNQSGLASPNSQLLGIMSDNSWPVYVTGPYSLTMQMTGPFPFLLNTWVGFQGMIFDPTFVMQNGGPGTPAAFNPYFNLNAIPGTGPYMVTGAQESGFVKFAQNANYWGKNLTSAQIVANPLLDPGHYSSIIVYDKQSDTSIYVDLTTNAAQIGLVTASDLQLLQANPGYAFASYPYPAINAWMEMNNKIFPTNITLVRQAIVHAINYSDLIQTAALGYGSRFLGPEAPFYGQYYDPGNLKPYQYDVKTAENDLAQAGFPNGTGLPTMTIYVDSQGAVWQTPAAEIIQANLEAIGMNINIQVISNTQYYTPFGSYSYNAQHANQIWQLAFDDPTGWAPDYVAPTDYWTAFVTTMSTFGNYAIYNNSQVDQDVLFMQQSNNQTAILAHLADAQQRIYNDAPDAWLFTAQLPVIQGTYAYQKSVIGGFYMDPNLDGVSDIPVLNTIYPAS